jgi:thiamine-triphosphatase
MDQGIYVRLRNGKWEAKARQAGGFVNSQFAEYKGFEDVDALVQEAFGGRIEGQFLYSLHRIAEFSTRREKWDIAGFEVVVDETDFGHTVGEVELCEWVERQPEESDENHKRNIRAMGMMMDMRIEPFMKEHRQVFPPLPSGTHPKPVGKLSAYFAWKKKMEKREIMTNDEKGNGER